MPAARQLLLTGAAGQGVRVGRATGYDERLVRKLGDRPPVAWRMLGEACPHGVHVARVRRGRSFRCDWPWDKQVEALAVRPSMTPMTRALVVHVPLVAFDGLPFVATVSGFVVLAAVATGARLAEDDRILFDLEPAGAWREAVESRWFHTGPGRHWFAWHPDRLGPPADTMSAWPPHLPAS